MNLKNFFKITRGSLVGALLATGLGANLLIFPQFGKMWINLSFDLPGACMPMKKTEKVVMVLIDDESHEVFNLDPGRPWPREMYATLINRLNEEGAKGVVFDVLFTGSSDNPEVDQKFAKSMEDFGNVVLGADFLKNTQNMNAEGRNLAPPYELFDAVVWDIGAVETLADNDFTVRKHFLHLPSQLFSSLSWATAEMVGLPVSTNETVKLSRKYINYNGSPMRMIPNFGIHKTIQHSERIEKYHRECPEGYFKDKVVFIGSSIKTVLQGEHKDEYRNPAAVMLREAGDDRMLPGVSIQAAKYLNLVRQDWYEELSPNIHLLIIIASGIFFGFFLPKFKPVKATLIALISTILVIISSYNMLLYNHKWFAWMIIVALQIPIALLWSIAYNSLSLYVEKRLLMQSLSNYVSPSAAKQILKNPELLKPGASQSNLSILFSDIAGFTTVSEGMSPDDLATMMNGYFEAAIAKIQDSGGTIVKLIGDAIFAVWNAPLTQEDHNFKACQGALFLRDGIGEFKAPSGEILVTRVGLHRGNASVGNFGSSKRFDYTAFGENINMAARLEGLNKYTGTGTLVTQDLLEGIEDQFVTRLVGHFLLKGFEKNIVTVYELISFPDKAQETKEWRDCYQDAIEKFKKREWDQAVAGFNKTIEIHKDEGPSKFYLTHIEEFRKNPPPDSWIGEIALSEK